MSNQKIKHYLCVMLGLLHLLAPITLKAATEQSSPRKSVTVLVVEQGTKEPIIGAVVRADGATTPRVTGIDGKCTLTFNTPVSKANFKVSFMGYKAFEGTVHFSAETITIVLTPDNEVLDDVIVTGQKRYTSVLQQAVAIDTKSLDKSTSISLGKMLEQIPGVSTISAGSSISKPVIQGMHSSRIVLINNGVRLESQSWGTDHAPEIDHTGASIVEVIKGAESVRYGHGAIGGVALFNQAPLPFGHDRFYIKCKTNLGYATNGRAYDGAGSLEMGYKDWGLRLHGMYQKSGDYSTAEYVLNNTGFNNISFSAYAGYKRDRLTATLFASLYTARSGIYYLSAISDIQQLLNRFEQGRPEESTIKPFSYTIEPPFQQSQHFTAKAEVDWDIAEKHNLEVKVSYQNNLRQEFENRKRDDLSWLPMQDLVLTTYATDAAWSGTWNENHSSQAGVSAMYQTNYNNPGTKQPAFIPNYASLTMGVFGIHKATFGKLQASAGLRYDYRALDVYGYTSVNNFKKYHEFKLYASVTGSLAAHYQFNDHWAARANVGLAWRPPDINELYATGLHHGTYWVVGNRGLLPEIGVKPVIGGTYRNDWIIVEPSAFFQHVHNYIYDNIGQGLDRYQNHPSGKYPRFIYEQDDARLFGGDILTTIRPFEGFNIMLRGEWINARNITRDSWLPFMPSDRYGLGLSYERDFGKDQKWHASIAFDSSYVTKQKRFDPDKDLAPDSPPAYFIANANAEVAYALPKGRSVKLMLMGDNIFNALYKEYTDRFRFFAHAMGAKYTVRTIIEF